MDESCKLLPLFLPKLSHHFELNGILPEQFLHSWHLTLFASRPIGTSWNQFFAIKSHDSFLPPMCPPVSKVPPFIVCYLLIYVYF